MEKSGKQYYILLAGAVFIFVASYAVGFVIGKRAGMQEAEKRFAIEKQNLLKTIASLSPVSRPKVEEKVVIVNASSKSENETSNQTAEQTQKPSVKEEQAKRETIETAEKAEPKETQELQTTETKPKTEQQGNYYIQVGVFRNKSNVAKLVNKLQSKGFNAKSIILPGGKVKVIVGYFSKDDVKKAYMEIKRIGINGIVKRRKS
jgi:cell division protein FtsN